MAETPTPKLGPPTVTPPVAKAPPPPPAAPPAAPPPEKKAKAPEPKPAEPKNHGGIDKLEWAAIHGPDPGCVYELFRPKAWRPIARFPGQEEDTPKGKFGAFVRNEDKPCADCGAVVFEIITREGSMRCHGCGAARA